MMQSGSLNHRIMFQKFQEKSPQRFKLVYA